MVLLRSRNKLKLHISLFFNSIITRKEPRVRVLVKEALSWNGEELARIMELGLQVRTTRLNGLS
jgi:hypothetical protein